VSRLEHLVRFYNLLEILETKLGGRRQLCGCDGRMGWPDRGIYFFFEPGEIRTDSGAGSRVVRVGTHAVSSGSKSTLWGRLAQHRGTKNGISGNHRGSVFRLLIGAAMSARYPNLSQPSWGTGQSAPRSVRDVEQVVEGKVSEYISAMPFLWLKAEDEPSARSIRAYIERHSIALLSNAASGTPLDDCSDGWLGRYCPSDKVQLSGLWNSRSVADHYHPESLDALDLLVQRV
jgi:hypothetical protein